MEKLDPIKFHQMYGVRKPRTVYYSKDFLDYSLMVAVTAALIGVSYGFGHAISIVGYALCAWMLVVFMIRHGVELSVPLILRRPQDLLYMFLYKLRNIKPVYLVAVSVLLAENVFVYFTPSLPHYSQLLGKVAVYLFFIHLGLLTGYRTVILFSHLRKKELVREVLMQTPWKKVINEKTNITLEIFHAYFTGVLTHVALVAPWYIIITHVKYSAIFLPVALLLNVLVHKKWLKTFNYWFYRDHWLGHNSEIEFIYSHGPHHDVIPSGLIGVSGNGFLEGFMRHTIGAPTPFYNPAFSALMYSIDVKIDIDLHQYIPGIYPKISRQYMQTIQHSTHHFGRLEPYGFGMKIDQPEVTDEYRQQFGSYPDEVTNSASIDETLTGFKWKNPIHEMTLKLYDKYQV